ncbi:MAG: succinate dehydrogenase cytochrome b subunit [Prevotellaceae bacterium]|jgi:succinate dehydrogenase / fumarate reductase cytochrome b subunit|nr:succinate dehydrogenase cytochrome b subunit [Prevotellaceae bacterium]
MSNIFSSSIGKKLIMSISGLFLIVFLLLHLSINLVAIISKEAYAVACEFMDTNIFIQIMVPVLALGFAIHIIYAIIITLKNQKARPVKYAITSTAKASTWASRNMFVLGIIVLGFLGLHLAHFWYKMQFQHLVMGKEIAPETGHILISALFKQPLYAILYIVWIWALWFHLCHGFWSAFQTIGVNNQKWITRWQCIAKIYATVVAVGFTIIPLYFLSGLA